MNSNVEDSHRTKGLLRLTMACNERCPFCNVPMEDYERLTPPAEEIERQLQTFVDAGERTLTISGGEPTLLRKRLLQTIVSARTKGIPFVELQSNAVLIDQRYAEELQSAGLTSAFISLLSEQPELHDELAGLKGAFAKCIHGIKMLLDVGIQVTLNPVLARSSQHRLLEYIHFVGTELPEIQAISLSAVQPHGRAAMNWQLLPDYEELAQLVPKAVEIASEYDIRVLNPYCGLPVCIGWNNRLDRCVEAIESQTGGWQEKPNISNRGDKSQRGDCQWCAYRSVCGGAWHAYWEHRAGKGLIPPAKMIPPWIAIQNDQHQQVRCLTSIEDWQEEDINSPTFWLVLRQIKWKDIPSIIAVGNTELVLLCDPTGLAARQPKAKDLIKCIRRIQKLYSLSTKRLHLLIDQSQYSEIDVQAMVILGERLGCNVKIGQDFPAEML